MFVCDLLAERHRLNALFDGVVAARWQVLLAHLPLYACIEFFNYVGSIVNYAAVGLSIFYLSRTQVSMHACVVDTCTQRSHRYLVPHHSLLYPRTSACGGETI